MYLKLQIVKTNRKLQACLHRKKYQGQQAALFTELAKRPDGPRPRPEATVPQPQREAIPQRRRPPQPRAVRQGVRQPQPIPLPGRRRVRQPQPGPRGWQLYIPPDVGEHKEDEPQGPAEGGYIQLGPEDVLRLQNIRPHPGPIGPDPDPDAPQRKVVILDPNLPVPDDIPDSVAVDQILQGLEGILDNEPADETPEQQKQRYLQNWDTILQLIRSHRSNRIALDETQRGRLTSLQHELANRYGAATGEDIAEIGVQFMK